MKAKVVRGRGFKGVCGYVVDREHSEAICGPLLGRSARALACEFSAVRHLRPEVAKPVWHTSLSLPPGETLSRERWAAVAEDFMRGMGFDDRHAWTAWRHGDKEHEHIHIIACRVACDGSLWAGKHDVMQAISLTSELEAKHGLQATKQFPPKTQNQKRSVNKGEIEQALRMGEQPVRLQLQEAIDSALAGCPTLLGFIQRLEVAGVSVRLNQASTGRISGISFECGGVAFKGSQLGKAYSFSQLSKKLEHEQTQCGVTTAEPAAIRSGADEAVRAEHRQPGPSAGGGSKSDREPAGCYGSGPSAPRGIEGPSNHGADEQLSAVEKHNRRREGSREGNVRQLARASGSGAIARIRLSEGRQGAAERLEIRGRLRPVERGCHHRLREMVCAPCGTGGRPGSERASSAEVARKGAAGAVNEPSRARSTGRDREGELER